LLGSGCAYFNVLYNARAKYDEAQAQELQALLTDPERTKIGPQEDRLYQEAFEKAAKVVKFYPQSKWVDDALLLMGQCSLQKGDYTTAIRKFDEILTIFPDSDLASHALLDKARAQIETKEYAAAEEAITRAEQLGQKDIKDDIEYFSGVIHERQGQLDDAKKAYAKVLEDYSNSEWLAEAGLALGEIQTTEKDLEGAVASYERVRTKAHTPEERFTGGLEKGQALLVNGHYDRAEKTFRDLSKRTVNEKQRGQALNKLGQALQKGGNAEAAFATYREILGKMPRTEAAADAQLAIAQTFDEGGDYVRAKEEYEKVNEQGTGFEAWRTASERITEIQRVLDLRDGIDKEGESKDEALHKRFLLAEQLLEKIGDVPGALAQYSAVAEQASGTELGARSLFATAWVYENRMSLPDTAEVLYYKLASTYRGTDADAAARRKLGLPVWKFAKIEIPPPNFTVASQAAATSGEVVLKRVEPRAAKLPEGQTEATVWVRVTLGDAGQVTAAKVSKSGGEDVDAAALEAAKATTFRPVSEGGPAVSVLEYHFPPGAKPQENAADSAKAAAENQLRNEASAGKQTPVPGAIPADSTRALAPDHGAADSASSIPAAADSTLASPPAAADSSLSSPPAAADSSLSSPPAVTDSTNVTPPDSPEGEPPPELDPNFDPSSGD
jgi:TonB family protein